MDKDFGVKVVDKRKNWEARVEMAVYRLPKSELGSYEKLVYSILCGHANRNGGATVYVKTIAEEASCCDRQVRRALANLEACRLIARKAQYLPDVGQTFNIYEVYGIDNYSPHDCQSGEGMTDSHGGPDCQSGFNIVEQPQDNSKTYSPTESAETAQTDSRPVDVSEIPTAMRPTVKYFLHETGRENIEPSELIPLRALERDHFPTRVNLEIDAAVARFRRSGRDPTTLTIDYLYESLRHQPGRKPKPRVPAAEAKRAKEEREANTAWEKERHEEVMREVREWRETLE